MTTPPDGWDHDEQELPDELTRKLEGLAPPPPIPLDILRAAGTGVLPADLDRAAQRYLDRHARTRALLEDLDQGTSLDAERQAQLFQRITLLTQEVDRPRRSAPWRWQVAAAIGVITVMGAAWWARGPDRPEPAPAAIATKAPEPTPPAVTVAPPTFTIPLERPDVRISLRAMTWRGQGPDNPVLLALKPALDAFRAGDYSAADREFTTVANRYPDLVEAALYQGVSRLFLNDLTGATERLQQARSIGDPAFADDVEWYLAAVEERSGNLPAARQRLQAICDRGRMTRACSVLASNK
jgi:hypothetical protein